jgi:hypothetical protein
MSRGASPLEETIMDTIFALKLPGGLASRADELGSTLFAVKPFAAGEPVMRLEHVIWRTTPGVATVSDARGHHFYDPILAMVADRVDANCRLSLELMALIARRDIAAGETISHDFHAAAAEQATRPCETQPTQAREASGLSLHA